MPGCAVVEVEIQNVQHEYSTIEGVQEDVLDILQNLKGIAIVLHSRDEVSLVLEKKGPGVVTAGDIVLDLCKKNGLMFLDNVLPDNVKKRVDKGVMIGAGSNQEAAEVGRKYTKRRMPW